MSYHLLKSAFILLSICERVFFNLMEQPVMCFKRKKSRVFIHLPFSDVDGKLTDALIDEKHMQINCNLLKM